MAKYIKEVFWIKVTKEIFLQNIFAAIIHEKKYIEFYVLCLP